RPSRPSGTSRIRSRSDRMVTTGLSSSAGTSDLARPPHALDLAIGLPVQARDGAERAIAAVRTALDPRGSGLRWRTIVAIPRAADGGEEPLAADPASDVLHVPFAPQPSDALQVPYHGLTGRARALHAIFREAQAHGARACIVIDPRAPLP